MTDEIDRKKTWETRLSELSHREQNIILGLDRAELFRAGLLDVKKIEGRPVTLQELREGDLPEE